MTATAPAPRDERARDGDRPSKHGAILGQFLALLEIAGRKDSPVELPPTCATCAFRAGTMPNQTAGTALIAFNIVMGIDRDRFACHHGMKDGEPQKLCVGYMAAMLAPFSFTKEALAVMAKELDAMGDGPDEIRAAFDAWLAKADPEGKLDVYQAARAWARVSQPSGDGR